MSHKILIIDDESELLELLKARLVSNKYDVVTASNGREGLSKWKEENPDLVILDIMMPEMDGYTVVQESKSAEDIRKVPIIMLTAKDGMRDLFEVEGVKAYLTKPFDDKELVQTVAQCLEDNQ